MIKRLIIVFLSITIYSFYFYKLYNNVPLPCESLSDIIIKIIGCIILSILILFFVVVIIEALWGIIRFIVNFIIGRDVIKECFIIYISELLN